MVSKRKVAVLMKAGVSKQQRININLSWLILCLCAYSTQNYGYRHVVFAPSSSNVYGSAGFAGIGNSLASVKGDHDKLGWNEVKVRTYDPVHIHFYSNAFTPTFNGLMSSAAGSLLSVVYALLRVATQLSALAV